MALGRACDVENDKPELTPREVYRRLSGIAKGYEDAGSISAPFADLLDDISAWTLATEGRKSEVESLYATNAELLSRLNQLTAENVKLADRVGILDRLLHEANMKFVETNAALRDVRQVDPRVAVLKSENTKLCQEVERLRAEGSTIDSSEPAMLKATYAGPSAYDVFNAVPPGGTLVYEAPGDDV